MFGTLLEGFAVKSINARAWPILNTGIKRPQRKPGANPVNRFRVMKSSLEGKSFNRLVKKHTKKFALVEETLKKALTLIQRACVCVCVFICPVEVAHGFIACRLIAMV